MESMNDRLRKMLEDNAGEVLRPARTTRFTPQEDGSLVRQIFDADGKCILEQLITNEQRMAKEARFSLNLSQQEFADMLGISVRTLHDWEQGRRKPSGAAKTLLKVVAHNPQAVQEAIQVSG